LSLAETPSGAGLTSADSVVTGCARCVISAPAWPIWAGPCTLIRA